jgi:predicted DNA-binding transcriptional regulator YafY
MARNDRLFALAALLRGHRVRTADELAAALGVSVRTLYRDVAALRAMGVPVDGAAGVGYRLAAEGDLPAVAFTGAELEALALGARLVATWSDPELALAARSAVARIEAALPSALRSVLMDVPLYAPRWRAPEPPAALGLVRQATVAGLWLDLDYVDLRGARSARRVRPLSLHFWGQVWTLGAWCELRQGFRAFRVDLIQAATQGTPFPVEPGRGREDLFHHYQTRVPETP